MTRKVYLYFVATFLLGAVVGAAGVLLYGWYGGQWHRPGRPNKEEIVRRLTRDLELTESQVGEIRKIFDESGAKFRALEQEVGPRFQAIRQERRDRIRAVLTPEQREKFDEIIRRREAKEKRRKGPPPPPSPPPS
jgi:Spy/CpxP family protein refolding chaperone